MCACAHVCARAPSGVSQLTEDAVLDACHTWAKNQHQKQWPAKDHGGLAAWIAPKPGRGLHKMLSLGISYSIWGHGQLKPQVRVLQMMGGIRSVSREWAA